MAQRSTTTLPLQGSAGILTSLRACHASDAVVLVERFVEGMNGRHGWVPMGMAYAAGTPSYRYRSGPRLLCIACRTVDVMGYSRCCIFCTTPMLPIQQLDNECHTQSDSSPIGSTVSTSTWMPHTAGVYRVVALRPDYAVPVLVSAAAPNSAAAYGGNAKVLGTHSTSKEPFGYHPAVVETVRALKQTIKPPVSSYRYHRVWTKPPVVVQGALHMRYARVIAGPISHTRIVQLQSKVSSASSSSSASSPQPCFECQAGEPLHGTIALTDRYGTKHRNHPCLQHQLTMSVCFVAAALATCLKSQPVARSHRHRLVFC